MSVIAPTAESPAHKPKAAVTDSPKSVPGGVSTDAGLGLPLFLSMASPSGELATIQRQPGKQLSKSPQAFPILVQAKLTINQPGDPFEQEADRVAELAVGRSAGTGSDDERRSGSPPAVQRKCAACGAGLPCPKCEEEEHIQTKPVSSVSPTLTSVNLAPPDSGAPLTDGIRSRVEPVLGADLSSVRVHTSTAAQATAAQLQAKAFTHRNHIWLGPGQSPDDQRLLAHEATHVVQQEGAPGLVQRQPDLDAGATSGVPSEIVSEGRSLTDDRIAMRNEHESLSHPVLAAAASLRRPNQHASSNDRAGDYGAASRVDDSSASGTPRFLTGGSPAPQIQHELAHVVQHGPGSAPRIQRQGETSSPGETPSDEPQVSEASEASQHMHRQYPRLAEALTLGQWTHIVLAAEARARKQEAGEATTAESSEVSIQVPLNTILEPAARFVDMDIWDTVFDLFYKVDQSPTAGILLRNEIAREWFRANAVNPQTDQVTISLIDPGGRQPGPAQLEFTWRKKSLTDSLGAIQLGWLDEDMSNRGAELMVRPLRSAEADVSRDARELAEAARLKREKERIEQKLAKVIEEANQNLANARLLEIETYHRLVSEAAARAHEIGGLSLEEGQRRRAASYMPGVAEFFKTNSLALFDLLKRTRDWRVGKNLEEHALKEEEMWALLSEGKFTCVSRTDLGSSGVGRGLVCREAEEPMRLYAQGEISYREMEALEELR
ncbi:MAG TPA: hypothetical protein DCE44_03115, partial [Verrucomicrobiales bacterium]|nr:hypothetical protein [Verrucomicrobiales bacterium]